MKATPAKLKNGNWGARVEGRPQSGDVVTVVAKSGKSWNATIDRVIWTGDGVSLCSTVLDRFTRRPSYRPGFSGNGGWCNCGGSEDLLSMGYARFAGQVVKCPECGKKAEVG